MATSAFANSLLSSSSSTSLSHGVMPSTNNALLPSRISVFASQKLIFSSHLKLKKKNMTNSTSRTTFCSLDSAKDPKEEQTPIELKYPAYPTVMDINQIRDILPHRFPFLLVDRVIEHNPGVSAVAIKNVTINDNFFPGHFPERPIMPGVLMVEAMAQVGGLVMLQPEVGGSRENFFFAGIDKVRFRKPVIAGDTLVMRMTLTKLQKRFGIAKMEGKAYVGGEVVCEGEFLMATGSA